MQDADYAFTRQKKKKRRCRNKVIKNDVAIGLFLVTQ